LRDQIKGDEVDGMHGDVRNTYKILVGKSEGNWTLWET